MLVSCLAEPCLAAAEGNTGSDLRKVTWPDIVRLVDEHPRLAAGRLYVTAARAAVSAAGTVPNPSLDVTLGRGEARDADRSSVERSLELSLPLGWVTQRGYKQAAATAELEASKYEAESLRRDVLLQLRVFFWNTAYDQERVAALAVLESQMAQLAHSVQRRVEKGEARPVEQTRVEVELEKVSSDVAAARVSLRANREQLRLWLGGTKELVVEADLSMIPEARALELALAAARSNHPAIEARRAKVEVQAAELVIEKRARIPSVALKAFTQEDVDRRGYGGGIAVDLPLWNWNSGRIAQAQAQLAAARKQLEAQTRDIASAVIESHGACLAASETATRFKQHILPRSERAAAVMERTYHLGEASLFEAIDARRVLAETRRQYLAALVQAQIDCSRFNTLIGVEEQ